MTLWVEERKKERGVGRVNCSVLRRVVVMA
jgi:hypothetical protein